MVRLIGVVLALASCNQVYNLDETGLSPDLDSDGAFDSIDNCRALANADQLDTDTDGIGDVCDLCPRIASRIDHDEDGDGAGDDCDLCPAEPNFPYDADGDGVGDDCDNDFATKNKLVLFEAFADISDRWQPSAPWIATDDAAMPTSTAAELRETTTPIPASGTTVGWIRLGFSSTAPWQRGDRFGFKLVDSGGMTVAGCVVDCASSLCEVQRSPAPPGEFPPVASPTPYETLELNNSITVAACVLEGAVHSGARITHGAAHLVLVSSPRIHLRYVAVWQ